MKLRDLRHGLADALRHWGRLLDLRLGGRDLRLCLAQRGLVAASTSCWVVAREGSAFCRS